ncbi:hypothetical protein MLD38_040911 [Melastoma candidum]|nr:hypothetical protein MLD38_040911 [Melastoma candidum]
MLLVDNSSITLHNDMQDCYIDICSPEVLSLFTDNFDYQHLRRHFVKGLLVDDIMGYKILTHEIHSSYAARIDNYRSYDTISKDIIQRWTYPLVPDVLFPGDSPTRLDRQGMYCASEIQLSRSAKVGPLIVIGSSTVVGSNTTVVNSVIGKGCIIGSNVLIEGSYVWDNVVIEDGDTIHSSTRGQVDKPNGGSSSDLSEMQQQSIPELGLGGMGYIWSICEGCHEEEWKHSVAPIPPEKLTEITRAIEDDLDLANMDRNAPASSGELKPDTQVDSEDDENEDSRDDSTYFEKEVEATFLRAVNENIKVDHVILEVNSLRLSYNMQSVDCAGAIFYSMMRLASQLSHSTASELYKNVGSVVSKWQKLLKSYLPGKDEEIEVILKFEEICLESVKELSPLFTQILHFLYDKEILSEEAIQDWETEKADADESDKVFVKQAEKFLQWLREASEEEE